MRQLNPDILLHTALFSPPPHWAIVSSAAASVLTVWAFSAYLIWSYAIVMPRHASKQRMQQKKKSSSVGMKCVVCVIRGIRCNLRIVLLWHSFSWWQVTSLTEPLALCYVESQIARSLRCQIVCPVATRKRMSDVLPPNLNRKKGPKKKTKGIQCFIQWSIVSRTVSLSCSHMCKASV